MRLTFFLQVVCTSRRNSRVFFRPRAAHIAAAHYAEADEFGRDLWRAYAEGRLDDPMAQEAAEALEARKRAQDVGQTEAGRPQEKVFGLKSARSFVLLHSKLFKRFDENGGRLLG